MTSDHEPVKDRRHNGNDKWMRRVMIVGVALVVLTLGVVSAALWWVLVLGR